MTIIIPTWLLITIICLYIIKVMLSQIMVRKGVKVILESGLPSAIASLLAGEKVLRIQSEDNVEDSSNR